MKKYIPVDFDEKGNVILGRERNTPTSNGFIPTTWAPPAPVSEGSGLKSISISPVLGTTPAIDTVFPIYYEDLTDEEKQNGVKRYVTADSLPDSFDVTFTPTDDWHISYWDEEQEDDVFLDAGESWTYTAEPENGFIMLECDASNGIPVDDEPPSEYFFVQINIGKSAYRNDITLEYNGAAEGLGNYSSGAWAGTQLSVPDSNIRIVFDGVEMFTYLSSPDGYFTADGTVNGFEVSVQNSSLGLRVSVADESATGPSPSLESYCATPKALSVEYYV